MEKQTTENFSSWGSSPHGPGRKIKGALLFFFCTFFLAFASLAQDEPGEAETGYRYLKLTIQGAVGKHKVTLSEINWMVDQEAYPATSATKFSNNVTAPETNNSATAWRAYDGITDSPSSVWRPNNKDYPYSIIIDLGSGGAISPTGIRIAIESDDRAIASFTAEGSNDGSSWATLFSESGLTQADWNSNSFKAFEFPDMAAPTAPTGLSASNITEDSFTLRWEASTDNRGVAFYEVFKGSESIGTTATDSLRVTGLECGSSYAMSVKATDAAGNVSEAGPALAVNTTECETPGGDGYRYLRLTALGGTTTYYVLIEEISWLVGSVKYPKEPATSASTNITATVGQETAWEAYDGVYTLQSAWSTRTTDYPYSITLDLGEGEAINPTGIEIGVEWNGRTMSAFSVEGSTDGSEWTSLYSVSGLTDKDWKRDAINTFLFSTDGDAEAPTAPTGLTASDVAPDSFTLSWDASTDNVGVVSYEVFAGTELVGATNSTSMEVKEMYCNSTYEMTVTAQDAAGNNSAPSQAISVATADCGDTPNLIGNGEFDNGTDGWRTIFHSPAAGSFEVVTDADMSGANAGKINISSGGANWQIELFTSLGLESGKTYEISFQAKAAAERTAMVTFQRASDPYNNYWQETINLTTTTQEFGPFLWTSDISDEVARLNFRAGGSDADVWLDAIVVKEIHITQDPEAPTAPGNVTATDIAENSFTLTWDASTDNVGVFSYEVFAGYVSQGTTTTTSMEVTGLACNTSYNVTVIARDVAGNLAKSADKSVATAGCSGTNNSASLGMNMSSPRSWNSEFIFTNLAHYSLAWMPVETAPAFRVRIPVEELTADRYLKPGESGRLTVFWDLNAKYLPQGDYVFTYDGTAEVSFSSYSSNGITEVSDSPGRIVINNAKTSGSVFLYFDVTENSTEDPIRNIRFTELDRENSTDIFRPEIVADYAKLEAFRFMDWMKVNNSTMTSWEEYPADNALLQTGNISFNYMIALANQTGMDAWFTAPLLADDDFLRTMAGRIRDELNPDLRAYIELSNEVWNGGFAATGQAAAKARELGLTDLTNNKQAAGVYYGYRTAQMENIFEEVFNQAATKPRLTTVVAWQAVDTWSFENMVLPGYRMVMGDTAAPEAVAIAPYFGGSLGSAANEAEVLTWDMDMFYDQLFYNAYADRLSGSSIHLAHSFSSMKAYKEIVEKYGIPEYLAYEGGQHLVAGNNNAAMVNLLAEANRDRRMYDAYIAYFNAWQAVGGDLFAYFASTSSYGRSGSWGWKEYPSQTREEAPKYDAILTWSNNNSQLSAGSSSVMRTSKPENNVNAFGDNILVYPNPADGGSVTIKFDKNEGNNFKIINMNGKVYADEIVNQEIKTFNLESFKAGLYIFRINGVSRKVIVH